MRKRPEYPNDGHKTNCAKEIGAVRVMVEFLTTERFHTVEEIAHFTIHTSADLKPKVKAIKTWEDMARLTVAELRSSADTLEKYYDDAKNGTLSPRDIGGEA